MILGDLNADCSYVTIKGWRAVRLRSDPSFRWLIGDEQDTTVRERTHCAYDRSAGVQHWIAPEKHTAPHDLYVVFIIDLPESSSMDVR